MWQFGMGCGGWMAIISNATLRCHALVTNNVFTAMPLGALFHFCVFKLCAFLFSAICQFWLVCAHNCGHARLLRALIEVIRHCAFREHDTCGLIRPMSCSILVSIFSVCVDSNYTWAHYNISISSPSGGGGGAQVHS